MDHDLRRLTGAIAKTHPAVGKTVSKQTLNALGDNLARGLPEEASVLDFLDVTQQLVDTVQGGHIVVYPRGLRARNTFSRPTRTLPVRLERLPGGEAVVARVAPGVDSSLLGQRVFRLDSRSIDSLVRRSAYFAGGSDGNNLSGARNRATQRLGRYIDWAYGEADSFQLALQDSTVVLPADRPRDRAHEAKLQKNKQKAPKRRPIAYGLDSARRIAVIDINSFSGYDPYNLRWPKVWRRVLAKAEADSAQALIIDLRDNGGGRSANIRQVLRRLEPQAVKLYEPWTMPASGWVHASPLLKLGFVPAMLLGSGSEQRFGRTMRHRVQPSNGVRYGGPVYVLINSGTFSAASATAAMLKSSGRATLIGEEAGGNYHETYAGLFSTIKLRRTGLRVRMPHLRIPLAVDERVQPFGKTLQPDVILPKTLADVLDARDLVLLQTLELIAAKLR